MTPGIGQIQKKKKKISNMAKRFWLSCGGFSVGSQYSSGPTTGSPLAKTGLYPIISGLPDAFENQI